MSSAHTVRAILFASAVIAAAEAAIAEIELVQHTLAAVAGTPTSTWRRRAPMDFYRTRIEARSHEGEVATLARKAIRGTKEAAGEASRSFADSISQIE